MTSSRAVAFEVVVVDHHRGTRVGHPLGVGALMIGRRIRIGNQDRGAPRCGDLEDRATRSREDQVARRERVGKPGLVGEERVAVRVGGVCQALADLVVVAVAADMEHVEIAIRRPGPGERLERAAVDRPGALAAAEDQDTAIVGCDPETLARRGAVRSRDGRGHRPARDEVAIIVATVDREGEAHAPGAPGEQAVGEAEVAVGLGEDERQAERDRG